MTELEQGAGARASRTIAAWEAWIVQMDAALAARQAYRAALRRPPGLTSPFRRVRNAVPEGKIP